MSVQEGPRRRHALGAGERTARRSVCFDECGLRCALKRVCHGDVGVRVKLSACISSAYMSSPCLLPFRGHRHLLEWGPRLAVEQAHMAYGWNSWLWSH